MAEKTKPHPESIAPTKQEFEQNLFKIFNEVTAAVERLYNEAKENGKVHPDGYMIDACAVGSTVMYLDRRRALHKFFANLDSNTPDFYFISVYDNEVSITLRIDDAGQSYTLRRAANEILANRLEEVYGWKVYNNVRID